jgi:Basic region leucine zipper
MTLSSLQGLNIVQPEQQTASDAQDLLAIQPHFPDLTAQLDLWTNLPFESDEPPMHNDREKYQNQVPFSPTISNSEAGPTSSVPSPVSPSIDLSQFLGNFGIDAYSANAHAPSPALIGSSLAQLLALHPLPVGAFTHPPAVGAIPAVPQSPPPPQVKRPRTRKASVSNTDDQGESNESNPSNGTPVSIAEDKRRRNTAASARFRLKKKEREAALETRAKELEMKVNELERECEGLRRENGWLKGLVVGVTGAAAQQPTSLNTTSTKRPRDDPEHEK